MTASAISFSAPAIAQSTATSNTVTPMMGPGMMGPGMMGPGMMGPGMMGQGMMSGPHMMGGPGMMGWNGACGAHMGWFSWMPFAGISFLLLVLVVLGLIFVFRSGRHAGGPARSAGLDLLEHRYAKGEIERDEYLQKKADLQA